MNWELYIWFVAALLFMIFFSGIEMAFLSLNRLNVELKRKQGSARGKLLGKFIDRPSIFIGMTIVGFSLALTVFVLEAGTVLQPFWAYMGIASRTWQIVFEIIFCTVVVLVFVEFIPRAFFRAQSHIMLRNLAFTTNFFLWLFAPFIRMLFSLSDWILKYVFNVRSDDEENNLFVKNGLRFLFKDGPGSEKEDASTQLLENAQELPNIRVRECLVPRKEIIAVDVKAAIEDLRQKFIETKRSRIIIYKENIDDILGYVHELDMFKKPAAINDVLLSISAVPESMNVVDLINKLNKEAKSIAWVVDEFGGTAGIVTMEDVLEELFGEIWDEYDTDRFVEKRISEDEYIFSGRVETDYLEKKYDLAFNEDVDSETLSGYIINHHETIPAQKERIIIGDYEFDILSVSDTRIEMVKLKKLK